MNFLREDGWSKKFGIDISRSTLGNHTGHKVDIDKVPEKALVEKNPCKIGRSRYFVGVGRCVVHELPIRYFPSTVRVSSGDPEEIFAGFVFESGYSHSTLPADEVIVTGGSFHIYTMHYDSRDLFELNKRVYAGPNGLLTTVPGVEVGFVVSLPIVEDPYLGVMGHAVG